MRQPIEHCPACHGDLIVTQQTCVDCGTSIVGQFQPNIFSRLSPQDLAFIEAFVKNKGNVKEMERELGQSYWAIRNRLNEVIAALGFEAKPDDTAVAQASQQRQEILAQLNAGDISVDEAATLLKAVSS